VEVVRDEFTNLAGDIFDAQLLAWGYTPITANPSMLYVRSAPTNLIWGFYDTWISTTNLTQRTSTNFDAWFKWFDEKWQLRPQWLNHLEIGAPVDGGIFSWNSTFVYMQWEAKLQLTIYAGDGVRYLDQAWVYIVDAETNYNVTAALTDLSGYPGSITLTDPALIAIWATDPIATGEPRGKILNIGFNLLEGKYIVKVFFKSKDIGGAVDPFGRVDGVSVWDTFRDQPQHRYIYLGVNMPPSATGEDNDTCQVRTFNTKVYDLRISVVDQSPAARSIGSAPLTVTATDPHPDQVANFVTDASTGEKTLTLVPAGKYIIVAKSPVALYGKAASSISATVEARIIDIPYFALVPLPIFDVTVQLVTPSGKPITNAAVTVGGVALGVTDAAGSVSAPSIPGGSYTVTATWFGLDISPATPLAVSLSGTRLLTASHIAAVQVQVVGAQNQGLAGAQVTVKTGTTTVFSGIASSDGVVNLELPYGSYSITATHKGVEASQTASVTGDAVIKITTGVFIELLGQGLTFAGFALWVVAILVVVLILVIAAQEYNIYRRKRLPQLFGAGPTR